jgi:hypothetical protein
LSSGAAVAAEPSPIDCGNGAVFIAAGTNDPDHVNTQRLEDRYAAQGYVVDHVAYPATFWPLGAQSYDANIEAGGAELERTVVEYQAACADKPVVIVGYSQGARIAGDVLADIGSNGIDPSRVSGELYSDPRRSGDGRGAGAEVNFAGAYPGVILDGEREGNAFGVPVYSVCIEGDPVCDLPDLLHDPIGAIDALIGFFTKHATYGQYMGVDPASYDSATASPMTEDDAGAQVVMIKADPALTTILGELGLPNLLTPHFVDLPYPDLAILQPIAVAVLNFLPQLPELGHGAYLTDLLVLRDVLQGDPAAWAALFGSALSVVGYPINFVVDWTAVLDDLLDGRMPDFEFIASPAIRAVAINLGELLTGVSADRESSGRHAVRTDATLQTVTVVQTGTGGHLDTSEPSLLPSIEATRPVTEASAPELEEAGETQTGYQGRHVKPELPVDDVVLPGPPDESGASDEPVVDAPPAAPTVTVVVPDSPVLEVDTVDTAAVEFPAAAA